MHNDAFHFVTESITRVPALGMLRPFIDGNISLFIPSCQTIAQRKAQNGLWLFTATIGNTTFAFAVSDFRVSGGSFGIENSERMQAFLSTIKIPNLPLVFLINSMGVSFFEGRTVFNQAFALIPALEAYKNHAPIYTVALKNVFGLAAILFGLGCYRIALQEKSLINLAGPQVFRLFFNKNDEQASHSTASTANRSGRLIHEICYSDEHALARVFNLQQAISQDKTGKQELFISSIYDKRKLPRALEQAHIRSLQLLDAIADEGVEVFPNFDTRLKAFLCRIGTHPAGILINPLGFTDTLITSNTLNMYIEALALFRDLKVPVISILDTPGTDPRMAPGNYETIEKMIEVSRAIIDFPHKKIGIIAGRAYGGATLLGLPKIFGGNGNIALPDADMGIMKKEIIDALLSSSDNMLAMWQASHSSGHESLEDLLDLHIIDTVTEQAALKSALLAILQR